MLLLHSPMSFSIICELEKKQTKKKKQRNSPQYINNWEILTNKKKYTTHWVLKLTYAVWNKCQFKLRWKHFVDFLFQKHS